MFQKKISKDWIQVIDVYPYTRTWVDESYDSTSLTNSGPPTRTSFGTNPVTWLDPTFLLWNRFFLFCLFFFFSNGYSWLCYRTIVPNLFYNNRTLLSGWMNVRTKPWLGGEIDLTEVFMITVFIVVVYYPNVVTTIKIIDSVGIRFTVNDRVQYTIP